MRWIGSSVPPRITNALRAAARMAVARSGRECGQEDDGVGHVPVHRAGPDAEADGEVGMDVSASQVGQHQQGLPVRRKPTLPRKRSRRRAANGRDRYRRTELDRSIPDG